MDGVTSLIYLSFILLLIGGTYLIVAAHLIVERESKWWTGYGAPLAWIGFATASVGLFGLLSAGWLAGQPFHPHIRSMLAYLIPLFVALYAIFWFIFASRYVGLLSPQYELTVGLVAGTMLLAMPLGTTWTYLAAETVQPISIFALVPASILQLSAFVVAPLHFALAFGGIVVLVWGVYQYPTPTTSFAVGLIISGPLWYFSSYLAAPILSLQHVAYQSVTAVTAVAGLLGVGWVYASEELIDQRPKQSTIGRNTIIEELEEPVLVVRTDLTITDANRTAIEMFSSAETALLGTHISTVLPVSIQAELEQEAQEFPVTMNKGRRYVIRVSTVSSGRGDIVGKALIFHDVTEQERRQEQIQVLNRVLRHNVRNRGTTVLGMADLLMETETYEEEYMARLSDAMAELVQTGHRAQEIEDMMSANRVQDSSKALSGIVEEAVAVLQDEFETDLTVALSGSLQVTANEKILLPMITEALRNAVRHAEDRSPRITVSEQGMGKNDEIILSIEDDGSGIPQREVRVIQSGNEDSLNHGSGLGLWLLQWGATQLGGSVTFAQSESDGTDVRFHLPEDIVSLPESNTVELSEGK